jgi:hypothetical protein
MDGGRTDGCAAEVLKSTEIEASSMLGAEDRSWVGAGGDPDGQHGGDEDQVGRHHDEPEEGAQVVVSYYAGQGDGKGDLGPGGREG